MNAWMWDNATIFHELILFQRFYEAQPHAIHGSKPSSQMLWIYRKAMFPCLYTTHVIYFIKNKIFVVPYGYPITIAGRRREMAYLCSV